ncbi:MAG: toxin-antitoxin system YwqK family antitoxin [Bacteroidales bacterium]|nr:toxin-antitoxin system YwqK family antitoxin [Bacteroidales bacterium]
MNNIFKKILTVVLFLGLIFSFSNSFSQEKAKKGRRGMNQMDEFGRKQGTWRFFNYDGTLIYQVEYVNDKKHGLATRYHAGTGGVMEEVNYFDGLKDGECKKYYATGQVSAEGSYKSGRKEGLWITYYSVNGEKKSEGNYVRGRMDGAWKFYNSKAVLIASGTYKNDLKEGIWEYYDIDGNIIATKKYVKGSEYKAPAVKNVKGTSKTPPKKK